MGGIIAREGGSRDEDVVQQIALTICRVWEQYCSQYGFKVFVSPSALQKCCQAGSSILDHYFPQPPGPFKRVATLLVVARLKHLFHFEPVLSDEATQRWQAKVIALLIPVALAKLRVNLTPEKSEPTWRRLEAWKGFPSLHFKMEFLQFFEGMDNYKWLERETVDTRLAGFTERLITDRIARMIAATSLIVEGCYYWNEEKMPSDSRLRGKCCDFFDNRDVNFLKEFNYDRQIFQGIARKRSG